MGTILRVDLTSRKIEKVPLSEELRYNYIGGRGINVKILYDEVGPGLDGFDPESRLIFGTGPLTGTALATGRVNITGKSPSTGILGDSNGGSHFAPELKYAGYDHIVFTGKADKPLYLWIDDDIVELRDAEHLWGKMTGVTQEMIREEIGDPRVQVSCIGPAGENLVLFACIRVGFDGFCGKTGMGALMGSKNLKAVAVRGTKGVRVAQPDAFRELALNLKQRALQNPNYQPISTYGTARHLIQKQKMGTFANRNAQYAGPFAGYDEISPQTIREKYFIKDKACFGCVNHCRNWVEFKEGSNAGERGLFVEFGPTLSWGPMCDCSSAPAIFKANELCNEYGLESSETAQIIAATMEWYEKGLLNKQDLQGLDLKWGNSEAMIEMVHQIANRQGIGNLMAEGTVRAAKKIGKGAEKCITYCKGAIRSAGDVRGAIGYVLGLATSTRGPDHLRGSTALYGKPGQYEGQAKVVYENQCVCTIADAVEVCKFSTSYSGMEVSLRVLATLFSLATGIEMDEEGMRKISDRIWCLERAFIVREGITRKDDVLIGRYTDEPVRGGSLDGFIHDQEKWDRLLDEYYDLCGFDKESGVPTRAKLESLDLEGVADELERMGKLV